MGHTALLLIILVATSVKCQEQNNGSSTSSESSSNVDITKEIGLTVHSQTPEQISESQKTQDAPDDSLHSSKKRILKDNSENELIPSGELADADFFEAFVNAERKFLESERYFSSAVDSVYKNKNKNGQNIETDEDSGHPSEERINIQRIFRPQFQRRDNRQGVEFDDSRQDPPYYPERDIRGRQLIRDPTVTDARPLLLLTQGGYRRPYLGVTRSQRLEAIPKESEKLSDTNNNANSQGIRAEVDNNTPYRSPNPQYAPVSVIRHPFGPPVTQNFPNGIFNPQETAVPASEFANNLRSPYLVGNDVSGYSPVVRDPNFGAAQGTPVNSFPVGGYFVQQERPQYSQPQQFITGYQQPQFQPVPGFPGYETVNGVSRPDYSAFYANPTVVNGQSQGPVAPFPFYSSPQEIFGNADMLNLINNYRLSSPQYSSQFLKDSSPEAVRNQASSAETESQEIKEQEDASKNNFREDEYTGDSLQDNQQEKKDETIQFGARLSTQNQPLDNIFIRYPLTEAGYGTQESLPVQSNASQNGTSSGSALNRRIPRPFFPGPPRIEYPFPRGRDPYRDALNAFQPQRQNSENYNRTYEFSSEPFIRNAPAPFAYPSFQVQPPPNNLVFAYPDRNQESAGLSAPYAGGNNNDLALRSFTPPLAFQFQNAVTNREDSSKVPECAKKENATICLEDPDYPRREVLYSLNSNSYILERLVSPVQGLDELKEKSGEDIEDNFVCKSDVQRGKPLRAMNALGQWKVIVNVEQNLAEGRFVQPVRLETCRDVSEPCSYTNSRVRTKCVQKTSLQRLLVWNSERGIHVDNFRLPVACTCQVLEALET